MTTAKEAMKFAAENKVEMVDFKFSDMLGTWQHFTTPVSEFEDGIFEEEGVSPEQFRDIRLGLNQKGIRRPLRVPVREPRARWWEGCIVLTFFLPKGCYATTLLEEVLKTGHARPPSRPSSGQALGTVRS